MTEYPHCCYADGPSPNIHHPDCPRNPDYAITTRLHGARLSALLTVAEVALIDEPDTHDGLVAAIEGILTGRLEAVLRVSSTERLERIRRLVDYAEQHQERLSPRLIRAALGDGDA